MEKDEIINSLNRDLRAELSAVEIYSAHAGAIQKDEIADIIYDTTTIAMRKKHLMDEINHADWLKSKIRELEGKHKLRP